MRWLPFTLLALMLALGLGCEDLYMTPDQGIAVSNDGDVMELTAVPDAININSNGNATVLVYLYDENDEAIDGAAVQLTASLGTLAETELTTDAYGTAVTTFTPDGMPGYAVIVATYKSIYAIVRIKCFDGSDGDGTGGTDGGGGGGGGAE